MVCSAVSATCYDVHHHLHWGTQGSVRPHSITGTGSVTGSVLVSPNPETALDCSLLFVRQAGGRLVHPATCFVLAAHSLQHGDTQLLISVSEDVQPSH